jgi:zinc protease
MNRAVSCLFVLALAGCGGTAEAPKPVTPTQPMLVINQPDSQALPPPDAPPVVDGDVTTATVSGILVIVKKIPGAAFAGGQLYIRGGARNWTAANAGIEQMAVGVSATGGTKSLDKTAFSRKLGSLGANVWGDARSDFSLFGMTTPVGAWNDTFALLADAFRNPALPESEVELSRTQALAQLHHEQEDPDGQLWTLERKQIFAGHPYANRAIGTIESVTALKHEDLAPYLDKLRETSRLVFVAAGDVDAAHVFAQVKSAFGSLPRGSYVDTPMPALSFAKSQLTIEERKLPTNYIESAFVAPRQSDPDYVAGLVAMDGLSWRFWQEIRTKRNMTYAVSAGSYTNFAYPLGMLYVTAVDPNGTMKVMLDEVKRLRDEPMGDLELAGFKSSFLTSYLERYETPDGQASALADGQLYTGDWRLARGIPDRVRAVTAADIQAFAKKYIVHLQAAVVGDKSKIDATLFTSL